MDYDLPLDHIAEVTLIGTGGGYGESCVIHYGMNNWAIIDSCIDPSTNICLPLAYLEKIGVNLEKDVKFILCTHWHDDHIRGLSQLLEKCTSAEFHFARATDRMKFMMWVGLDYQKVSQEKTLSSTKEFKRCVDIAIANKIQVKQVNADQRIAAIQDLGVYIYTLSPSPTTMNNFDQEIAQLIDNYGAPGIKYIKQTPNDKSLVLFLKLGIHVAILGADLEVSDNSETGWLNILDHSTVVKDGRASLFKIPHHGSENGYHDRIWVELLTDSPIAKLTPWNKKGGLPTLNMISRYNKKTNNLFITSIGKERSMLKRDKSFKKLTDVFGVKITEVKYAYGIVRSRIDIQDNASIWDVELDGESCKL